MFATDRWVVLGFLMTLVAQEAPAKVSVVGDLDAFNVAVRSAVPGDEIVLANGTWRDVQLELSADGEVGRPIVCRAETPGKVILTGTSRLSLSGRHLVVRDLWFRDGALEREHVIEFAVGGRPAHDSRVTDTVVIDYNPEDRDVNYNWVHLRGTRNRVDHCTFRGKDHQGPLLVVRVDDIPNQHRIDHNLFAGRPPLGKNGGETVRIGDSRSSMRSSRTLVERNWFEHCDGEDEIISNKSCDNVYRQNHFRASYGALTLRHGNRCRVEQNVFSGAGKEGSGGVRVIGEDHVVVNNLFVNLRGTGFRSALMVMNGIPDSKLNEYFQVKRALIAHNTILDCASPVVIGLGAGSRNRVLPPVQTRFVNNLIAGEKAPLVQFLTGSADVSWSGNLFDGDPGFDLPERNVQRTVTWTWDDVRGPHPVEPARGVRFLAVDVDIRGNVRTQPPTVGAEESPGLDGPIAPLGRHETGASWYRMVEEKR